MTLDTAPHPSAPAPRAATPPTPPASRRVERRGTSIGAIVVGILAFLLSIVPVVGLVLAVVGLVQGIRGTRRRTSVRALAISGLVLSIVALLFAVPVSVGVVVAATSPAIRDSIASAVGAVEARAAVTPVATECFGFAVPVGFATGSNAPDLPACAVGLKRWGVFRDDGTIDANGVGSVIGRVTVERSSLAASGLASDATLDTIQAALEVNLVPSLGTVLSQQQITLGGEPAILTRVDSTDERTETSAIIVVVPPSPYTVADGEPLEVFVVTLSTAQGDGDAMVQAAVDAWEWR